ncbi:E3 ubiquitin-protein ligase UBR2 [Lamellibrachia satsuma]|nr:E3 ubiquitin-protein ligase UBR2 [Lamellibrachia satsuma]
MLESQCQRDTRRTRWRVSVRETHGGHVGESVSERDTEDMLESQCQSDTRRTRCVRETHGGDVGESVSERHTEDTLESQCQSDTLRTRWRISVRRDQDHNLYLNKILKHQECKKQFAVLFSKMYPALMKCFIDDDHDHSVCAVAESVQMFTVPTLARMLVTELNLLQVILDTFLEHCKPKLNTDGRFAFERQERNPAFRRSQYMLYDLKYVLTCRPSPQEWTDALRTSFLNGFSSMLKLLKSMQGMDAVTRQTGQHIEFEPEWEGAFNLQLKLADNLAIIQDWCGTDETVLLDAIAMTLNTLVACRDPSAKMTVCTVGQWKATCIKYDVSTQPVSIHLPVTRLLAGLYPHLNKLGLSFREAHKQQWLIHGQPQQLIADPWLRVSAVDLIEPSLRTQVLISQTQAGMWRRNGYSLLNQIYFYHNVRCCSEMYDKDVTMLQTGAALIDSNEFIIYLLNKFSLLNWAKEDYDMPSKDGSPDDCLRQVIVLAEEFLNLLIIIIGERYECGVGEVDPEDTIKREIIHQLCIHPMAHSELTKSLPENPYHETGIDHIVQQVAVFKKPVSSTGKGMYELKPECYTEYNPFFYHYTRAEQSKSEEMQRKRKKSLNEDQALPPPVPPPFAAGYIPVTKLLHSDLLLYLLRILLKRTAAKRSRSWSETQFEKVLHLIGLALYEEQRMHNAGQHFGFIEKATTDNSNILEMLQKLNGHPNITHEPQKDLLTWVIQLFTKTRQSVCGTDAVEMLPVMPSVSDEKLEKERKRKAELAAKRRLRIMAQISKMQKEFIRENSELFESTSCELKLAGSDMDISQSVAQFDMFPIAVGSKRSISSMTSVMLETCILCQEKQEITHNERAMVLASFIHKSTVLSKSRGKVIEDPEQHDPLFTSADLPVGAHTATCGHIMHADCWQRFFDAILAKERRRTLRFRHHVSYDIDKGEFLCPLCETLSNSVLPIIPHLGTLLKNNTEKEVDLSVNDWLDGIQKTVRSSIQEAKDRESQEEAYLFVPCPMSSITKMMAESVAKNFQLLFDYVYDDSSGHFSDSISEMLRKFSTDAYAIGLGVQADDDNIRVPILAWATCAYTITATEQCLRDEGKPLFGSLPSRQGDCLSSLVKFAAVCSQVIQPDVVKKHCITLLSALVCESADHRLQQTPSVLTMDMFDCLVKLCLSLPTLYAEDVSSNKLSRIPTGGLNDLHCLHMALTAHLVQIMLLAAFSEEQESMDTESEAGDCDEVVVTESVDTESEAGDCDDVVVTESMDTESEAGDCDEEEALLKTYLHLRHKAKLPCEHIPSAWQLWTYVREASLPFLRCAALFFHYLTGVAAPELLLEAGRDEFPLLCQYLALPASLAILFEQGTIIKRLVDSWCEDDSVQRQLLTTGGSSAVATIKYPMRVNHLIDLPHDYIELINKVSTFTCPSSDGDDSRAPALCLVCGKMLCSQSYCCQRDLDNMTVGAATAHAETCGAGIGIFLRVRECHVLLLFNRTKGCFVPAPYLDDYGETDQGLRRGNPLHLCMERYRKLQKLWLTHSIPEEIVHLLEANSNLMAIEWQHL